MIPALVYIFGFPQKLAQGTTLALMIPPIGLLAALQYWRAGDVDLRAGLVIAAFFLFGGLLGGRLAVDLDPGLMRKILAVGLAAIAVKMFFD